MIGVITGVARTALMQVARQFGREAMERIMAGEAIESVLTRDQLRELAKKTGKVALNELMKQGKDAVIEDYNKKNADWNARMNDATRNLDDGFGKNTTLYKEERDIANKNKIEDRRGLWNAYDSPSGFYRTGNTLYIAGTGGKDGSLNRDIMDDLLLVPARNIKHSEKYNDVMKYLKENSDVKRLVSHSLASAVVNQINNEMPDRFSSTTYATPTIRRKRKGKQDPRHKDYRNKADIVSFLDGYAETSNSNELNPLMAHSYINFKHNGMWHINPTTSISNGINPNTPVAV